MNPTALSTPIPTVPTPSITPAPKLTGTKKIQTFFTKKGTCQFDATGILAENKSKCTTKYIFKLLFLISGLLAVVGIVTLTVIFLFLPTFDMIVAGYIAVVTIFLIVIFFLCLAGTLIAYAGEKGWIWAIVVASGALVFFIIWEIIVHLPV